MNTWIWEKQSLEHSGRFLFTRTIRYENLVWVSELYNILKFIFSLKYVPAYLVTLYICHSTLLGQSFCTKHEKIDFKENESDERFGESSLKGPNNIECFTYKVSKSAGTYFSENMNTFLPLCTVYKCEKWYRYQINKESQASSMIYPLSRLYFHLSCSYFTNWIALQNCKIAILNCKGVVYQIKISQWFLTVLSNPH